MPKTTKYGWVYQSRDIEVLVAQPSWRRHWHSGAVERCSCQRERAEPQDADRVVGPLILPCMARDGSVAATLWFALASAGEPRARSVSISRKPDTSLGSCRPSIRLCAAPDTLGECLAPYGRSIFSTSSPPGGSVQPASQASSIYYCTL